MPVPVAASDAKSSKAPCPADCRSATVRPLNRVWCWRLGGDSARSPNVATDGCMDETTFDVVVIGTGPGGEGAAMQASKHGRRVAVVERAARIGGNCTHLATIPSKALRYAIFQLTEASHH